MNIECIDDSRLSDPELHGEYVAAKRRRRPFIDEIEPAVNVFRVVRQPEPRSGREDANIMPPRAEPVDRLGAGQLVASQNVRWIEIGQG
jgi:hypothetical protein